MTYFELYIKLQDMEGKSKSEAKVEFDFPLTGNKKRYTIIDLDIKRRVIILRNDECNRPLGH